MKTLTIDETGEKLEIVDDRTLYGTEQWWHVCPIPPKEKSRFPLVENFLKSIERRECEIWRSKHDSYERLDPVAAELRELLGMDKVYRESNQCSQPPKEKSLEEEVKAEWKSIAGEYGGPSSSQIVLMSVLDRRLKAIEEKIK